MDQDKFDGQGADTSRRSFLAGSMASMAALGLFGKMSLKNPFATVPGQERAAAAGEPTFKIGVGKVDITPDKPMNMAGYGTRNHPGSGKAYHRLYNRVLTLDDGKNKVVYVEVELIHTQGISAQTGLATTIREAMARRGIKPEQLALVAAHVHNGPVTSDAAYLKGVCDKTIALIDDCLKNARQGRLYFGRGRCDVACNRRGNDREGNYLWSYINRYGPSDHEVTLLKAVDMRGQPIAVAFNYGCHPITMGGYQYGSDWVGFCIDEIERQVGAPAVFLQGCAGDQRPDCPDPTYSLAFQSSVTELTPDGKPEEAPNPERPARYGRRIAAAVVEGLRAPMEQLDGPIRNSVTRFDVPGLAGVKRNTRPADWQIGSNFTTGDWTNNLVEREWPAYMQPRPRRWLRLAELIRDSVNPDGSFKNPQPVELFVNRIGTRFVHVGMSGEPCAGIGLRLKDQLRGLQVMVTGYTNFSSGYFLAAGQIVEGGYEAFYGSPKGVPLSPEAEDVYINNAMDVVEKLATTT